MGLLTEAQIAEIEQPYRVKWWGATCENSTKVIRAPIAGGGALIAFQPLATRPNYYVLEVPRYWIAEDEVYDHGEEIYEGTDLLDSSNP